jgi:hypothetical protein
LRGWSRATQFVLSLWLVLFAVGAGIALVQRDLLTRLQDEPSTVRLGDVTTSDDQIHALNGAALGLLALTVAVWLVWWTLAYRAAERTRGNLRYRRSWAIGGWFVPFANFVVPKRVADDLWTASVVPEWPRDEESTSSYLILGWWTSCILSVAIALFAQRHPDTVSELLTRNAVLLGRTVVVVVSAVLAIRLVGRITAGFVAQSEPVHEERVARTRRPALVIVSAVAVVLVVAGITVASRAVFDVDAHVTTVEGHGGRITPKGHHFSLVVPGDWSVTERSALARGVAFDAVHLQSGTDVTVIESPARGPVDPVFLKETFSKQPGVTGVIDDGAADLPAGHALTLSLTAVGEDGSPFAGRVFAFSAGARNFLVLVSAPAGKGDSYDLVLDLIVESFRIEA